MIKPPTYPARPLNGGPFPKARPKPAFTAWAYEPKYDGWRALVHVPTGTMFNRHGQQLSIANDFRAALDGIRTTLDAEAFKWVDCEGLQRRHEFGQGSLIVFDCIPEPAYGDTPYATRRSWLGAVLPELRLHPDKRAFPLVSIPPFLDPTSAWQDLQNLNRALRVNFYEGLVAKRVDSRYPIQLHSPDLACADWVKHRWAF